MPVGAGRAPARVRPAVPAATPRQKNELRHVVLNAWLPAVGAQSTGHAVDGFRDRRERALVTRQALLTGSLPPVWALRLFGVADQHLGEDHSVRLRELPEPHACSAADLVLAPIAEWSPEPTAAPRHGGTAGRGEPVEARTRVVPVVDDELLPLRFDAAVSGADLEREGRIGRRSRPLRAPDVRVPPDIVAGLRGHEERSAWDAARLTVG